MSGLSKSTEAGIFGGLKGAGDLLTRNARVAGRRVGLVFEETRLSWLEVNARSCRFAHELRKSGIERGDRVGIYAGNSHQWVEAAFALAKLGAVLVNVNNRLAPLEVRHILNDAAVKALIVGKAELPNAKLATEDTPKLKLMIGIDSDEPGLENYEAMVSCGADDEPALDHPLQYDDPLMLLYTSGTTGFPKGAIYTHGSMLIGAMYHVHAIGARSTHRVMLPSPMYSAAGIAGIYAHTYVGAHCVILDFDPDKVLHTLARERITFTNLVPTTIQRLIHRDDLGEFDLSHLETILYGGSPISLRVLREAKRKLPHVGFRQTFASTETGLKGTVLEPAEHELALSDPMLIDANRSPNTFCSASATATPPTPRLATKAVMLTPPSASNASTRAIQTTNCTAQVSTPSMTGLAGSPPSRRAERFSHDTSSALAYKATWTPTSA